MKENQGQIHIVGGWLTLQKGVELQIAGTDKILTVKRVCLNDKYILEMETLPAEDDEFFAASHPSDFDALKSTEEVSGLEFEDDPPESDLDTDGG